MTSNLAVAKSVSTLGSDPNYWTTAANVILRVKAEIRSFAALTINHLLEKPSLAIISPQERAKLTLC